MSNLDAVEVKCMLELARVTATDLATDLAEKMLADEVRRF